MPNLAKIYSDATGVLEKQEAKEFVKEQEELQARQIEKSALHLDWLSNPETAGFLKKLSDEATVLIDNAISLAQSTAVDTTKQIITNLIRVGEIRRIIKTYGK